MINERRKRRFYFLLKKFLKRVDESKQVMLYLSHKVKESKKYIKRMVKIMKSKIVDIHVLDGYYVLEMADGAFYIESNDGEDLGFVVPYDAELLAINLSIGYDLLGSLKNNWSFEGISYLNTKEATK